MPIFYLDSGSIDQLEISSSLLVSGSFIVTGSINTTQGLTGSLLGTASWANNATTASHAVTASYILNAISASYALSASNALTASFLNPLRQGVVITGSLIVSGSSNIDEVIIRGDTMITGTLMISGAAATELDVRGNVNIFGDTIITGSLIVSGSQGSGVFSKGGTIADVVNLVATSGSYIVWRAPFSCSVVALYGKREAGGIAQINAVRSGSGAGRTLHTASNLRLTTDDLWTRANTVANTSYVPGDSLEIIISGSGNDQVAVQVDFIRVL
jgi:hypothetical protein